MLIRFSVENFLSFRTCETFSMLPGKSTLKPQHKSNAIDGVSVLKSAVMYGANASGKSNLIKAIAFGKQLVLEGTKAELPISYDKFRLNKNSNANNSHIEFEIQHKNKNYAYGFVFNNQQIIEEWLYEINKKSETKIFERSGIYNFDLKHLNRLNSKAEIQFIEFTAKSTPANQLFLTHIRNNNVKMNVSDISPILNVIDWFQNTLTVLYPSTKNITKKFELLENSDLQKIFSELLVYFDTGINGIELEEVEYEKIDIPIEIKENLKNSLLNNNSTKKIGFLSNPFNDKYYITSVNDNSELEAKILKTRHKGSENISELFDLKDESDGTRRILDLIPMLIDLFKDSNVFIIDEVERSLHPNLVYDLFDIFLKNCQNINSQLIVASHESKLLTQNLLRKDEIWFVTKDNEGASHLHSLEDYKVRFDKEVRKDYLLGRYKGIPRIGNRSQLTVLPLTQA